MKAQIIEKEGQFYKECGVVMLETTQERYDKYLVINKEGKLCIWDTNKFGSQRTLPVQHLYITSDDEIKEGDWYVTNLAGELVVKKHESVGGFRNVLNVNDKKIIATNDTSLGVVKYTEGGYVINGGVPIPLPQPSDKFIQVYIEAYNKGKKIEKVLVEVDDYVTNDNLLEKRIVIKNNNIIIKKVKDSWTRDELYFYLSEFGNYLRDNYYGVGAPKLLPLTNGLSAGTVNEILEYWINENL